MLTGQPAFQGEDVTEILAAVVRGGANLDLLPANIHPRVREVIIRCLPRDLKKRYRDIADAQYEVEQALADGKRFLMMKESGSSASAARGPRRINIVLNWTEELKQRVPVK